MRTCMEFKGTGEGMWRAIKSALHIVAGSLVKHPLKGVEASDQITSGSPM
jgi:hypothetical protein